MNLQNARDKMETLNIKYEEMRKTPSNTNEHIECLKNYSSQCEHITETGVDTVITTWAFLKGLSENNSEKKRLLSIDLKYHRNIELVKYIASKTGIDFTFKQEDDLKVEIEQTDLLFIDTWHVYGHLKRELELYGPNVKKFIILHDTTIDSQYGECIRNIHHVLVNKLYSTGAMTVEDVGATVQDLVNIAETNNYSMKDVTHGLWEAVEEFLSSHSNEWILDHRYTHNNGLTILKRI